MRELPEPDTPPEEARNIGLKEMPYSTAAFILAIQKQAYEDGLRDAAKACKQLETAIDGGGNAYYRPADARQCVSAIEAMLTASQKEQQ